MKQLRILVLFTLLACSSDKKQDAAGDTTPKAFTLIFKSTDTEPLMAFPRLTPAEEDSLTSHYVVNPGDTLSITLQDNQQLVDLFYPADWDYFYTVSNGDTLLAEMNADKKAVFRLVNCKKETFRTALEEAFGESPRKKELDDLLQETIESKDANKAEMLNTYRKANKEYYDSLRDSLLNSKGASALILADVVLMEQYNKLSDLNAAVQDVELTALLKSDKYLNTDNFNNRNLGTLLNTYSYHNIIRNPQNKTLVEKYDTEFEGFPEEIKADFKLRAIIQMIVQKYDRKTTIQHIDDYISNYGASNTLKDWMKKIEYGAVESDDLDLADANNHKQTWTALVKQWKGKVIFVDFWASWCGPCIAELPYSKKLKKELKDVVFVYLALSDEETAWRAATEKYELKENSYLITNTESSGFVSQHKINTIPRYMIVDKNGDIINPDAPRPSSTEISYQLKEALKK